MKYRSIENYMYYVRHTLDMQIYVSFFNAKNYIDNKNKNIVCMAWQENIKLLNREM